MSVYGLLLFVHWTGIKFKIKTRPWYILRSDNADIFILIEYVWFPIEELRDTSSNWIRAKMFTDGW
jgi:hypothetical protein